MTYHNSKRRSLYLPPSRNTMKPIQLSKAIEGFTLACKARKLSEHTLADYGRTLTRFLAHVGDVPINQITTANVTAFLAAQPWGEKTVLNYHIGLASLWTWAVKEGYAKEHIVRKVERPRPKKVAIVPFSEVEIRAIMTGIRRNETRDRALILLLLDTGLRASEVCGITRADIDLSARRVKVLGKYNKERLVPFSARTGSAIFKLLAESDEKKPFPLDRTSLAHLVGLIGKRAGVKGVHPHRFRHTFAVTYLRNGGDPYTLQEILGHSTMEMVKVYLSLAQVDIDSAHKRASPVENWHL